MIQNVPSVLSPRGQGAGDLAPLGIFLLVAASVVVLVIAVLIVMLAFRRRGTLTEHAPINAGGGARWIQIGGILLPVIILTAAFVATLSALSKFPKENGAAAASAGEPEISVTGKQWWWDIEYRFPGSETRFPSPNELHVPVGHPVRIRISSTDVIHSFWIPQLHPKIDAIPGRFNEVVIRADRPGTYRGECAEFCGRQHAHMAMTVVAEAPDRYHQWLSAQLAPAAASADSAALRGQHLFAGGACALCHTVRGTEARGKVAPDLTHLASRKMIAGGVLPNTRANLQGWVVDAPSRKPGTQMPRLTEFTGPQLNDLVSYLETLK